MKAILAILTLTTIIVSLALASMDYQSHLGGRIAENIIKLRQQDQFAGSQYASKIQSDDFAAAKQVKKVLALTEKIPVHCLQSSETWSQERVKLLRLPFIPDSNIHSAWQQAQQFCRDMPDI